MIAPQNRLIFWAGFLGIAFALLLAIEPSAANAVVAATPVCVLLALLDAVLGTRRVRGIRASLPEITRLTKEREGELRVELDNASTRARRVRLGIAFPSGLNAAAEDLVTELPADSKQSVVSWPVVASERGYYEIDRVYIETASPMGLWNARNVSPCSGQIRVYPNLLRERRLLAAVFLNRGMLGLHAQRQMGKGREVEKLREYMPGDSYDDIHWKTTAKRSRPITKVHQIERTQEIYVVIDASRLSARTVTAPPDVVGIVSAAAIRTESTQLERFVTAALVLGLVAERQGDLFGVAAFDDQVRAFVRARNGGAHYTACRDAIYSLEARPVNPDFGEICSFLRLRLRRRALIVFLTNLDDPVLAESFVRDVGLVARRHLVLVNVLAGGTVQPLFSDASIETVDALYERLGGHLQWQALRQIETVLKRTGVSLSMLANERLCPELVSQYINVKQRQLL